MFELTASGPDLRAEFIQLIWFIFSVGQFFTFIPVFREYKKCAGYILVYCKSILKSNLDFVKCHSCLFLLDKHLLWVRNFT